MAARTARQRDCLRAVLDFCLLPTGRCRSVPPPRTLLTAAFFPQENVRSPCAYPGFDSDVISDGGWGEWDMRALEGCLSKCCVSMLMLCLSRSPFRSVALFCVLPSPTVLGTAFLRHVQRVSAQASPSALQMRARSFPGAAPCHTFSIRNVHGTQSSAEHPKGRKLEARVEGESAPGPVW